ncbi:MAG: hypothetical protein ACJAXW_002686 [Candidatus Azotimanducaceae bacterium]
MALSFILIRDFEKYTPNAGFTMTVKKIMRYLSHATLLLLALIGPISGLYAEEIDIPFVVENACPFEGCTYGEWTVIKDTTVFQRPEKVSPISIAARHST